MKSKKKIQRSSRYAFYLLSALQLEQWKSIQPVVYLVYCGAGIQVLLWNQFIFGHECLKWKEEPLLVWDSIENLVLQHLNFGPAWNPFVWIASLIIISQYFFPRRLSRLPLSCHCWPYCFQRSLVENIIGKLISQGLDANSDYWGAYATRSVCCISS